MFLANLLPDGGFGVFRWSIGQLSDETPRITLILATVAAAAGLLAGFVMGPAMDAAALGDDEAHSSGVNLRVQRAVLFVLSGLLTAAGVVVAGPVGFVGLVCPHLVRLVAGPSHRVLIIGAALAGASLIIGADAAVRLLRLGGGLMPIGVVTALVGGPTFIVLLRREMATGRYP
jgi:iron complex transport system permease protein